MKRLLLLAFLAALPAHANGIESYNRAHRALGGMPVHLETVWCTPDNDCVVRTLPGALRAAECASGGLMKALAMRDGDPELAGRELRFWMCGHGMRI